MIVIPDAKRSGIRVSQGEGIEVPAYAGTIVDPGSSLQSSARDDI